jgi:hypothetical protein
MHGWRKVEEKAGSLRKVLQYFQTKHKFKSSPLLKEIKNIQQWSKINSKNVNPTQLFTRFAWTPSHTNNPT